MDMQKKYRCRVKHVYYEDIEVNGDNEFDARYNAEMKCGDVYLQGGRYIPYNDLNGIEVIYVDEIR